MLDFSRKQKYHGYDAFIEDERKRKEKQNSCGSLPVTGFRMRSRHYL